MKKLFGLLSVSLFVVTMMTGGAWASVLDIGATGGMNIPDDDVDGSVTGAYVVGSEWLGGQSQPIDVDLGAASESPYTANTIDRSEIYYVPSINIATGNTIVIEIKNGAIEANTNYGFYSYNSDDRAARLTDTLSNDNGYTSMRFQFDIDVNAGDVLSMVPDGTNLTGAGAPQADNRPTLIFTREDLAGGEMTLQVTEAKDTNGVDLVAPLTPIETVAKDVAQWIAKIQNPIGAGVYEDGAATSVIDVEADPSRGKFVSEGNNTDTPSDTESVAAVFVELNLDVNDGINIFFASYTLTLNQTQGAIDSVKIRFPEEDFDADNGTWVLETTWLEHPLSTPGANEILITVDGETVMRVGDFTVDLVIDPIEENVDDVQSLTNERAFIWTINAMQCKIPYLTLSIPNYEPVIKIAVEYTEEAELSMDAIINEVPDGPTTTQEAVSIKTLPAESLETVTEDELMEAFDLDDDKSYHVELTLTVVAPQNTVHVSAFQKSPAGRTDVPVLYNTNNENDARRWQ